MNQEEKSRSGSLRMLCTLNSSLSGRGRGRSGQGATAHGEAGFIIGFGRCCMCRGALCCRYCQLLLRSERRDQSPAPVGAACGEEGLDLRGGKGSSDDRSGVEVATARAAESNPSSSAGARLWSRGRGYEIVSIFLLGSVEYLRAHTTASQHTASRLITAAHDQA
jgi:hypothetical protein